MTEKSTATEDFRVELSDDEHGTEMCERWADRLALARMHFARGDLKACQREIDEAARYAAPSLAALLSVALSALRRFLHICLGLRWPTCSLGKHRNGDRAGAGRSRMGRSERASVGVLPRLCGKIQASSEVSAARVGRQRYPPSAASILARVSSGVASAICSRASVSASRNLAIEAFAARRLSK